MAASPRPSGAPVLRALLRDCRHLLSERGVANGAALAQAVVAGLGQLNEPHRQRFFEHLAQDFNPDQAQTLAAAQRYAAQPSAEHLLQLTAVVEPARQELFRRINRTPGGTQALVDLRRAVLERLPKQPMLKVVDADLLHLLGSWFNAGFLQLVRVDWNSPAQLLEQIIRHEAVHQIDGWDDLRRRLQPDRRCFAFFHPQLPNEPLIFVEVALVPEMAGAVAPLIDKRAQPLPSEQFKVAVFYSISNCQPGLRSVSMGNFLIKRVAEALKQEFPQLKVFCTLSPIPGFLAWLKRRPDLPSLPGLAGVGLTRAQAALDELDKAVGGNWDLLSNSNTLAALPHKAHQALWHAAAVYLVYQSPTPAGDPVARFHLDNGARLERLNANANLSPVGLKQSAGLMVNYLYNLANIERCHDRFVHGQVVHSRTLSALL